MRHYNWHWYAACVICCSEIVHIYIKHITHFYWSQPHDGFVLQQYEERVCSRRINGTARNRMASGQSHARSAVITHHAAHAVLAVRKRKLPWGVTSVKEWATLPESAYVAKKERNRVSVRHVHVRVPRMINPKRKEKGGEKAEPPSTSLCGPAHIHIQATLSARWLARVLPRATNLPTWRQRTVTTSTATNSCAYVMLVNFSSEELTFLRQRFLV